MGILLRPVVKRRRRSWTSFWEAILVVRRGHWFGWRNVGAERMSFQLHGSEIIMHAPSGPGAMRNEARVASPPPFLNLPVSTTMVVLTLFEHYNTYLAKSSEDIFYTVSSAFA